MKLKPTEVVEQENKTLYLALDEAIRGYKSPEGGPYGVSYLMAADFGWQACLAHLMERAEPFDEKAFGDWLDEKMRNDYDDPSLYTCAEWGHDQLTAKLAARDELLFEMKQMIREQEAMINSMGASIAYSQRSRHANALAELTTQDVRQMALRCQEINNKLKSLTGGGE